MIDRNLIKNAYSILKSYAYFENLNFFLKADIAKFENTRFDKKLKKINDFFVLKDVATFDKWLSGIDVKILPKKIQSHLDSKQDNGALFLSNKKTSNSYPVSAVNYLISAPVELYIIEALWSIIVGSLLDEQLSSSSYGNRVSSKIKKLREHLDEGTRIAPTGMFQIYMENYNKWRDSSITKAIEIVEHGKNDVAIFSLDLKGFYYNIDIDFKEIEDFIENNQTPELVDISLYLNDLLMSVHTKYQEKLLPYINITNKNLKGGGLPIGFMSSAILANWYLRDFDKDIEKDIRPSYYGRYVDDIIFVFNSPDIGSENNGKEIDTFIRNTLPSFITFSEEDSNEFLLTEKYHSLPLQKEKLIFHYFHKEHSLAGLKVFKQEIENRSSAFRFLPEDHISNDLDVFAYDILYDGSANKLRSIIGLAENETELSKYLSSHILAHRLCKLPSNENTLKQIKLFFKGENALRFNRLWEKVLSYSLITKQYKFTLDFYQRIIDYIEKIKWNGDNDTDKTISAGIKNSLHEYINISLALNASLLDQDIIFGEKKTEDTSLRTISNIIENASELSLLTRQFRKSNLLRHHLISWPLANFTDYSGDLTQDNLFSEINSHEISQKKIEYSPRYIHADEYQLFYLLEHLQTGNLYDFTLDNSFHKNNCEVKKIKKGKALKVTVDNKIKKDEIKIALANMKIDKKSIENACRKDRSPNLSYIRQKNLYRILNAANEEEADVLLLPELSIPVSWLPFMAAHSRRKKIAIIFGLEHWVVNSKAYNILVEMLPYTCNSKYHSSMLCFRIKNHYAPSEIDTLTSFRLQICSPKPKNHKYHLVQWKGISFATYNCFELANIEHRSLFRSQLDIMFACVWNKDTNYYQHITESSARDLHCYVAQANTSHYGGSCVIQPSKSATSNKIYVKGGENTCILTATLDIKNLREAQFRTSRAHDELIKHNPPGFNYEKLLKRIK